MSLRTLFATLALVMFPLASSASCFGHTEDTASSCMDGFVWDSDSQACVEVVSG